MLNIFYSALSEDSPTVGVTCSTKPESCSSSQSARICLMSDLLTIGVAGISDFGLPSRLVTPTRRASIILTPIPTYSPRSCRPLEHGEIRPEQHTSELQSLMRIPYSVFSLTTQHYQSSTLH